MISRCVLLYAGLSACGKRIARWRVFDAMKLYGFRGVTDLQKLFGCLNANDYILFLHGNM